MHTVVTERARVVEGTAPYPWPFDGVLDGSRLALVVTGAQQFWFERTDGVPAALAAIAALAEAVRIGGGSVVFVRHESGQARPGVGPRLHEPDWELVVTPSAGDHVVDAAGLDGFYGSPLDGVLRAAGSDHVLVAGLGLEGTVHSTLRSANDTGYECLLVADACSAHDPALVASSISTVEMSGGIFGAVGTTVAVLAALAGSRSGSGEETS